MAARRTVDVAVAGVIGAWALFYLRPVWSPAAAVVVVLAVACALVWRRPRACLVVALAAIATAWLAGVPTAGDVPEWGVAMALLVGVSLGAFEPVRVAAGGVLLLALAISRYTAPPDVGFVEVGDVLWVAAAIGGPAALAGVLTRARRRACEERALVAALAATSPQEAARLAVAQERERVLGDVHAILRTAVSSMLAHAQAADEADPPAATERLQAAQRAGREAITELRLVLGQLRSPSPVPGRTQEAPATGQARDWRRRADGVDWWLTLGVVLAVGDLWIWRDSFPPPMPEPNFLSTIVTVAAVSTIALRRTHPLIGAVALGGFLAVSGLFDAPVAFGYAVLFTILALTWSALARPEVRAVAAVAVLLGGAIRYATPQDPAFGVLVAATLATAVMSAGTAHHRGSADTNAVHAASLDRDRRAASTEAVRAQRLAVARDLHDVVSHGVVVMTVQAGAAEALLTHDPAAARAALDRVRAVGSATLAELDHLFTALRTDDDTGVRGPVSHDVAALVQRMRAGGLRVELLVRPGPDPPADPLVYRVVQESLTNSLRHAPQATVRVTITSSEPATTVEVLDDGPGPTPGTARGYGLVGITERVQHAAGHVDTGPGANGRGFRVLARIPTHQEVTT